MRNKNSKEAALTISQDVVTIRSFCSPEEIASYIFPDFFSERDHSKSLYTQKESLIRDAAKPDANVVLALTSDNTIIGFGVLTNPEPGDRWEQLGPGAMMEVRVIEVGRPWRSAHMASKILALVLSHPRIENTIAYMVGYSWTWDLSGTHLMADEYRKILVKLFSAHGFQELETNEPNICLKEENLFMCRLGQEVPERIVEQFNWLRFGIAPEHQEMPFVQQPSYEILQRIPRLRLPLEEAHLTGLTIAFDWKTDQLVCQASRQWERGINWQHYNRDFSFDHILTADRVILSNAQTKDLFDRYALGDYLTQISTKLKNYRHARLDYYFCNRSKIGFFHFTHNFPNGVSPLYHARTCGQIRFQDRGKAESAIIEDGLRESRGMAYANAWAGYPFGGAHSVVQAAEEDIGMDTAAGFLGYLIDLSRCLMLPGVNFPNEIVDVFHRHGYSNHICGGTDFLLDSIDHLAAHGLFIALNEAASRFFGPDKLRYKQIVVIGLDNVGRHLVENHFLNEAVEIYVANDQGYPDWLTDRPFGRIRRLAIEDALTFSCDILIPCNRQPIIDESIIEQLTCKMIFGATNNVLQADTVEEEIRLAALLQRKGIFYQPPWLHNLGGLIGAIELYLSENRIGEAEVLERIFKVCCEEMGDNIKQARALNRHPTEHAYRSLQPKIYT